MQLITKRNRNSVIACAAPAPTSFQTCGFGRLTVFFDIEHHNAEMQPFVRQKRFDFVKLGENIVGRTLFGGFALSAESARFGVYRYQPFVERYRINNGHIADFKKCGKLFPQSVKACGLYLYDAVFADDIGYETADLLLVAVLERFKVIFQNGMNGLFAVSSYSCSFVFAVKNL